MPSDGLSAVLAKMINMRSSALLGMYWYVRRGTGDVRVPYWGSDRTLLGIRHTYPMLLRKMVNMRTSALPVQITSQERYLPIPRKVTPDHC